MTSDSPASISIIASQVLEDLRIYLSVIKPDVYSSGIDLLSGSTIGQHTRHIIEFYQCLLEQSEGNSSITINYAERRRDYLIETVPAHALKCIEEVCTRLSHMNTTQFCMLNGEEHGTGSMIITTVGRELIYNIEHTIHHLAIIKIALKLVIPGLKLPEHFGVAPSTIRHRHEACAQ